MTTAPGAEKGERRGTARLRSGYYPRALITRMGIHELSVPHDREGRFSTRLFARYQRSEKALVAAFAEMYVQGVSTRKVKAITAELCGHAFSASASSRDQQDAGRRAGGLRRPPTGGGLPPTRFSTRAARRCAVIRGQAVLIAIGVDWEGRRNVLGVELASRESGTSWAGYQRQLLVGAWA